MFVSKCPRLYGELAVAATKSGREPNCWSIIVWGAFVSTLDDIHIKYTWFKPVKSVVCMAQEMCEHRIKSKPRNGFKSKESKQSLFLSEGHIQRLRLIRMGYRMPFTYWCNRYRQADGEYSTKPHERGCQFRKIINNARTGDPSCSISSICYTLNMQDAQTGSFVLQR